jgi:hypothetical protein
MLQGWHAISLPPLVSVEEQQQATMAQQELLNDRNHWFDLSANVWTLTIASTIIVNEPEIGIKIWWHQAQQEISPIDKQTINNNDNNRSRARTSNKISKSGGLHPIVV